MLNPHTCSLSDLRAEILHLEDDILLARADYYESLDGCLWDEDRSLELRDEWEAGVDQHEFLKGILEDRIAEGW